MALSTRERPWRSALLVAAALAVACGGRRAGSEMPDAGTFVPSIPEIVDGGWQESAEPWDPPFEVERHMALHVWSHPGAVYVGCMAKSPQGQTLSSVSVNRGQGWSTWLAPEDAWFREMWEMRGFPDGHELIVPGVRNSLQMYEGESGFFHLAGSQVRERFGDASSHGRLFVVDDTLAYATVGNGSGRVLRYEPDAWELLETECPYGLTGLWADREVIFGIGGGAGIIVSFENGTWDVHDSNTVFGFMGIWGFAPDDVWACGSGGNLHHYDGTSWSAVQWPTAPSLAHHDWIRGLWGSDGVLFMYGPSMLIRYDPPDFEILLDLRCPGGARHCEIEHRISDLWGNGPDEVFLAMTETHQVPIQDGWDSYFEDVFLLYFDGNDFHWF